MGVIKYYKKGENMKKIHTILIIAVIVLIAIGCVLTLTGTSQQKGEGISYNESALAKKLSIDMNNWNYDETNDIYYQI